MRKSLAISLLALAACHPPSLRDRAVAFGGKVSALGSQAAKLVAPAAPKLQIDVQGLAVGMAKDAVQRRVASAEPITFQKSVRHSADAPAPAVRHDQEPALQVTHIDASKPEMFVLHGQTHAGKQICEAFTSMDACTSSCTGKLRVNAFTPPDQIDPSSTKDCSCLEQQGGC